MGESLFLAACHDYMLFVTSVLFGKIKFLLLLLDEYHTGVAQFQHVDCHRRTERRQRFAPLSRSLLQQSVILLIFWCSYVIAFYY